MIDRKTEVVNQTTKGINYLMEKNNISVYHGIGSFIDSNHIKISSDKEQTIEAKT